MINTNYKCRFCGDKKEVLQPIGENGELKKTPCPECQEDSYNLFEALSFIKHNPAIIRKEDTTKPIEER